MAKVTILEASAPSTPSSGYVHIYAKTDGKVYSKDDAGNEYDLTAGAGSGSVTGVALTMPADFSVANSPITVDGTLAVTYASQTQNTVLAAPDGSNGTPSFRQLVNDDISDISMVLLAAGTLASNQAQINLTSIPSGYRSLKLHLSLRSTTAAASTQLLLQCNSNTTVSNYANQYISGTGATGAAAEQIGSVASVSAGFIPANSSPAGSYGMAEFEVADYANTSTVKTFVGKNTARFTAVSGGHTVLASGGSFLLTDAISSIQVKPAAGSLTASSHYSLWGMK